MRVATAAALLLRCVSALSDAPSIEAWALSNLLPAVSALFLLAGLWTPFAAALVTGIEVWHTASQTGDPWIHILVGALAVALTLLGPGAWSVDAHLFGWRRIDVRDRRKDVNGP
jgi:uncharacterized membrane protein YphA (DoxX/SURF4 family)